jgi:hypothetical protein
LFTDGDCTSDRGRDERALVQCADHAAQSGIPLLIYGTGEQYAYSLLLQLATRAGHGSFLKHVLDADVLQGHLESEVGFLRGVGVRGLVVEGMSLGVGTRLKFVTRFMPMQQSVAIVQVNTFMDVSGALDRARGQQYLIDVELESPSAGELPVLMLDLLGKSVAGQDRPFLDQITVSAKLTADPTQQTEVDPDIQKIQLLMAAAEQAHQQNYTAAADLYEQAGDGTMAAAMRQHQTNLRDGHRGAHETRRAAQTEVGGSVSVHWTVDLGQSGSQKEEP